VRRDLELVRRILLAIDADDFVPGKDLWIRGASDALVAYHVYLLQREHMIDALEAGASDAKHPWYVPMALMPAGRAWLDAARDDAVWTKFAESDGAKSSTPTIRNLGLALAHLADEARVTVE